MLTFEKVIDETRLVIEEMFFSHNLPVQDVVYCIKADDTYVGIIDYTLQQNKAILSYLLIHHDYEGYGYGTNAYYTFEEIVKRDDVEEIEITLIDKNERVKAFFEQLGFQQNNHVYIKQL
ncbi:GNAT family N-acetyltransferase [Bacillus sp. 3103sda1]|uniref:GNAT family N-acetyltransferase n=1 Tax=unclassified Bacillus (in: firmicutes) TaxID=185979 RepID=UPI00209FEDBA|nr:GNAT family N-acetyltransferase [Bacillus sp. 3103sda1]MCP1123615.1 GNAT family N-acetyltransferase [Bacillus sp. 3103sda1]